MEYVRTETHNGISSIEFHHPQSNSLPGKILEQLAYEIHFAGTHAESKVIILKSAGDKSFCAGASFDELVQIKTEAEGLKFFSGFAHVINAMRKVPQFIIARIHGKCIGGGVGLAAAADYAIAVEGSDIKLSELEDKWHYTSLEKIFFEEKIYKELEQKHATWDKVIEAIDNAFTPFKKKLKRVIGREDILNIEDDLADDGARLFEFCIRGYALGTRGFFSLTSRGDAG